MRLRLSTRGSTSSVKRVLRDGERRDLKKVLPTAVLLARSPQARNLPGYLGRADSKISAR